LGIIEVWQHFEQKLKVKLTSPPLHFRVYTRDAMIVSLPFIEGVLKLFALFTLFALVLAIILRRNQIWSFLSRYGG
jgi:hypothetical protein